MKFPKPFVPNSEIINAIIETPRSSGNKYAFDPETKMFKLKKILPAGLIFPLHFGFIPHTKGEDGDPLDVLVLMDEPSYPGCLVECNILGMIKAEQSEGTKIVRNDRVLAAAVESRRYAPMRTIKDLDKSIVEEIADFFKAYNKSENKEFKVLGYTGRHRCINEIKKHISHA